MGITIKSLAEIEKEVSIFIRVGVTGSGVTAAMFLPSPLSRITVGVSSKQSYYEAESCSQCYVLASPETVAIATVLVHGCNAVMNGTTQLHEEFLSNKPCLSPEPGPTQNQNRGTASGGLCVSFIWRPVSV